MLRIHLIGKKKGCFSRHLHPVRVFRNELLEAGLDARYFPGTLSPAITECDILVFLEGSYRDILPIASIERSAALEYLEKFLPRFARVIWFDDHDSSGMLRKYIFPLVDIYSKSQLMINTEYYKEEHLTGVLHRDYVHEKYDLADSKLFKGPALDEDIKKLRISWNLAMCNWGYRMASHPITAEFLQKYRKDYAIRYSYPDLSKRKKKVCYRVGLPDNASSVKWWRIRTREHLEAARNIIRDFDFNSDGLLGRRQYLDEMRNSVITPSPFGIGEICYRDFECFICGSLLFKPKMDHLRTWPDLYVDGETYISHEWDFGDFIDRLESILAEPHHYEEVAREGQRRFRKALNDGEAFALHFKSLLSE